MIQFSDPKEISQYLAKQEAQGKTTGFVPTMGALHKGHTALIEQAKREVDIAICSIFVNPLQFNRKEDLDSYPDRLEADRKMLEEVDCDILFTPSREALYPSEPKLDYDFGSLGKGMEADYRPGHFEGVAAVIDRFIRVLHPTKAYFGEKDYQQLAIVKWLVERENFETEIVGCKTIRFENGLAMSSRNYNLKEEDFETAAYIYQLMQYCKNHQKEFKPKELASYCFEKLQQDFKPEYFEIVDEETLKPIDKWEDSSRPRAFVAAYLSTVRLIDNMSLID